MDFDNLPVCERCGATLMGGSHYHCGQCDSLEVTSMLGHYSWGKMTCQMTPEELDAHYAKHRPGK